MKGVNAVTVDGGDGCNRACEVKEDAGVCPFFEPRKTRHEYGNRSKHFPNAQNGHEVRGVAEDAHEAIDSALHMRHLSEASAFDKKRDEYGGSPISNVFCLRSHANPPTMRSKLPMNFCQP